MENVLIVVAAIATTFAICTIVAVAVMYAV